MSEALRELAIQALSTPSLEAPEALSILADALLERGEIREPWKPMDRSGLTARHQRISERRSRAYVLGAAHDWARKATLGRVIVSGDDFEVGMIVQVSTADGRVYDAVAVPRHSDGDD